MGMHYILYNPLAGNGIRRKETEYLDVFYNR